MSIREKFKYYSTHIKIGMSFTVFTSVVGYVVNSTYSRLSNIINTGVLATERKSVSEYIYIDDPMYKVDCSQYHEDQQTTSLRLWKTIKRSLAWRLLWICRNGNRDQQNMALTQLASIKKFKDWDYLKFAQALDPDLAVLLAWCNGADLRYFLPPPLAIRRLASEYDLTLGKLQEIMISLKAKQSHRCLDHFIRKYYASIQESAEEGGDHIVKPELPTNQELLLLCLNAIHHHIVICDEHNKNPSNELPSDTIISMGIIPILSELLLRYKDNETIELAILKILGVLSLKDNIRVQFFQNGLLLYLSRWIRSADIRFSSNAALCLANLSGEQRFKPGLFLLYPIYRNTAPTKCDVLFLHGLRGGVFVTWRQRDLDGSKTLGLFESVIPTCCESSKDFMIHTSDDEYVSKPEKEAIFKKLNESDDWLGDMEIVMYDIPEHAERSKDRRYTLLKNKTIKLDQEVEDLCAHTACWPKDWLPKDCKNLRILGVNFETAVSEWFEGCEFDAKISQLDVRAAKIHRDIMEAGVGSKGTSIVWVAHSMGGLIVKKILINSHESNDIVAKETSERTKGIVFYSTPHKGSPVAMLPWATNALLCPSENVKLLREDSPMLEELNNKFITATDVKKWSIISFVETQPTLISAFFKFPVFFVHKNSADIGRGELFCLPLDHLTICKPSNRQSLVYKAVVDVVNMAIEQDSAHKKLFKIFHKKQANDF